MLQQWLNRCRNVFNFNAGHQILAIYYVSVQVWFATSKAGLDIYYNKPLIKVASQDLRLGILRKKEILESQSWMRAQSSVQFPFQKGIFGRKQSKNCVKVDIRVFWSCPILFFFPFTLCHLSRTVYRNKFLLVICHSF